MQGGMKQATIECTEDNRGEIYNFLSSLSKGEQVNIEEMRGPLGGALRGPSGGVTPPGASLTVNHTVLKGSRANLKKPAEFVGDL